MDTFTDKNSGKRFCMKLDANGDNIFAKSGVTNFNLIDWCKQFVSSNGTFVDIGAFIGTYSIILSEKCKSVVAFEAQKSNLDCLSIGISLNNRFNIKSYNVALGSKQGTGTLFQFSKIGDDSSLYRKNPNVISISEESVNIKTLDSYELTNIDLIKISVCGYELEVLKGSMVTLFENNFPPIIFESKADDWFSQDKEKLLNFAKFIGYKVHLISGFKNMYLASDHPMRKNQEEVTDKVEEVEKSAYDIKVLVDNYVNKQLQEDDSTPWDVWYELAKYYRLSDKQRESYDCIKRGLGALPPKDKEYMFYEELSIVAYYVDKKNEGYDACEKVVLSHNAPWSVRNYTLGNQKFYMRRLPLKNIFNIDYTLPADYIASSSSLIKTGDTYIMNIRGVNYSINNKGGYIIRDPDNIVRTRNFLVELKANTFDVISDHEIKDVSGIQLFPKNILGIEDVRIFSPSEFFCTYLEVNESRTPQICYCQYDKNTGEVKTVIPLMVGEALKCEKNWMPFLDTGDEVKFVYSIDPLRVYSMDRRDGSLKLLIESSLTPENLHDFRGGSGLIPYKDGWLCTIHQVNHGDPRKYFHRFIWFDKHFISLKYSEIFYFEGPQIEFNLSICHSPHGLLIPYSVNDNCSKIGLLNYEILESWLHL